MAGPQFVGPTGAQVNQQNIGNMQQGIQAIAETGKFLEGQRQFNEMEKRLNRQLDVDWMSKMVNSLIEASPNKSIKDVAKDNPGMLSLLMQKMDIPEVMANNIISQLPNSPLNFTEQNNMFARLLGNYGSGKPPVDVLNDFQKQIQDAMKVNFTGQPPAKEGDTSQGEETKPPLDMKPVDMKTGTAPTFSMDLMKQEIWDNIKGTKAPNAWQVGVDSILSRYEKRFPDRAQEIEAWRSNGLQDFSVGTQQGAIKRPLPSVKEGEAQATVPEAATDMLALGNENMSTEQKKAAFNNVLPGKKALPASKSGQTFRQWLIANPEKSKALHFIRNEKMRDTESLVEGAPNLYKEYSAQKGSQAAQTVAIKEPEKVQSALQTVVDNAEKIPTMKTKAEDKRAMIYVTEALTTESTRRMEANPEGLQTLLATASRAASNMDSITMQALLANPAAVLENLQRQSGMGALNAYKLEEARISLEKAGIDLATAKIKLQNAGITKEEDQLKFIASALKTQVMMSGVMPPEFATQYDSLQKTYLELTKDKNFATRKGDRLTPEAEALQKQAASIRDKINLMDKAVVSAVNSVAKLTGNDQLKSVGKLLESPTVYLENPVGALQFRRQARGIPWQGTDVFGNPVGSKAAPNEGAPVTAAKGAEPKVAPKYSQAELDIYKKMGIPVPQ